MRGRRWPARRALLLAMLLAGCAERAPERIDGDQIVVGVAPALWERLGPRLGRALEPTPFTLPDEQAFQLTAVDPATEGWEETRRATQLLLIGSPSDPWIADALERLNGAPPEIPSQIELTNLWARPQHVFLMILSPDDTRLSERVVSDLRGMYDRRYREYVVERMYFPEGPDAFLADTLQTIGGFELRVPVGYRWTRDGDVFLFDPPATDSSTAERRVMITWRSPIPEGAQSDARFLLDWREEVSRGHYGGRQTVDPSGVHGGPTTQQGSRAIQLLGGWRAGGERGPFLMRGVVCPMQDRMYLLDGWIHAPDQPGQEYMVQLESILNSFRCGTAEG